MEKKLPDCPTLKHHYTDERMSLGDIGSLYGVSRSAVGQALERCEVFRRSKSEARLIALGKGKFPDVRLHDFNRDFFKSWRPESAYLLGLVFADGHATRDTLQFVFGRRSRGLLGHISMLLGSDREAVEQDNHGYPAWRLHFSSVEMVQDMVNMGLPLGAKSKTKRFPSVPEGLERHFVRGYFDGNGSVTWRSSVVRFYTGSSDFVVGLRNCIWDCFVRDFGDSPSGGTIHSNSGRRVVFPNGKEHIVQRSFTLIYASKSDICNLYDWFYVDLPEHCALGQKRKAFGELVRMNEFYLT